MKKLDSIFGATEHVKILLYTLIVSSVISIVAVIALSWYILDVRRNDKNQAVPASPAILAQVPDVPTETDRSQYIIEVSDQNPNVGGIVNQVAKHMFLPAGNVTVATIKDVEGLREQYPDVYQYAKNGDKAIFYPNGLIIFDAAADKIVDVIRPVGQPQ